MQKMQQAQSPSSPPLQSQSPQPQLAQQQHPFALPNPYAQHLGMPNQMLPMQMNSQYAVQNNIMRNPSPVPVNTGGQGYPGNFWYIRFINAIHQFRVLPECPIRTVETNNCNRITRILESDSDETSSSNSICFQSFNTSNWCITRTNPLITFPIYSSVSQWSPLFWLILYHSIFTLFYLCNRNHLVLLSLSRSGHTHKGLLDCHLSALNGRGLSLVLNRPPFVYIDTSFYPVTVSQLQLWWCYIQVATVVQ